MDDGNFIELNQAFEPKLKCIIVLLTHLVLLLAHLLACLLYSTPSAFHPHAKFKVISVTIFSFSKARVFIIEILFLLHVDNTMRDIDCELQ